MFQRLALTALHRWGEKEGRKPLVLRGARQVGKTTLVKLFAREFDVFIELNLEEKENARLFAWEVSFDDLLAGIYVSMPRQVSGWKINELLSLLMRFKMNRKQSGLYAIFMRNVLIFM
jgi:hypothetical protein